MKNLLSFKILFALVLLISTMKNVSAQNTFPATGNVGIGTTSPVYPLHIKTGYRAIQIDGTDLTWTGMYINNTTTSGQPFYGYTNGNGKSAWHYIKANGDWSLYAGGDRLTVTAATGNLGIGIASPAYKLHIASPDVRAFQIDGSSSGYTGMYVNATVATGLPFYGYITNGRSAWSYLTPTGDFKIYNGGDRFVITSIGNILINKTTQTNTIYKLDVNGSVRANEVVVNTTGADFVFEDDYKLRPLSEVESFVKANKHLPEIPSAKVMSEEGMNVSDLSTTLLQKVEEITLYLIEMQKVNAQLQERVKTLESQTK